MSLNKEERREATAAISTMLFMGAWVIVCIVVIIKVLFDIF